MIQDIEKELISKFVQKQKQERVLWELDSPKKRNDVFVDRFSHAQVLDPLCMIPIGYLDKKELEDKLYKMSQVREVFFFGECYIGKLPLKVAIERASKYEMCIIYCGNGIGFYQGEQSVGKPPRYLLVSRR